MLKRQQRKSPRPGWTESAPWMGCSLRALARILAAGRFRVQPRYLPECLVDLLFASGNSSLALVQDFLYHRAVSRITLADDPIFIIGHWRTGTTLLHELLALDLRLRAPTNYECLVPHHFLLTGRWLKHWTGFTLPRARPMDPMRVTWDSPQEDEFALCNLGAASPYRAIAFPNEGWPAQATFEIESLPQRERHYWERTIVFFLKHVIHARPGRLVLKSPTHTFRLPTLLRLFPRAKFINLVRNPFEVFSSTVKLWQSLFEAYGYQRPTYEGLEARIIETFARMHQRLEATRGLVPGGGIMDIRYEDLLRDPLGKLEAIYAGLSLEEFGSVSPAVKDYLAERTDYVASRHTVDEPWSAAIRDQWKPYFERHGYLLDSSTARS